ncbi:MAG: VanZ family protein [Pyrinomonadaceae bacterium]
MSRNNNQWKQRLWRYGPLVIWLVIIFFASTGAMASSNTSRIVRPLVLWLYPSISEEGLATIHLIVRKLAHFTEYATLAILAARAFSTSSIILLQRWWFAFAVGLVVLYSLSDEFHQSFVATRTGSIYDSLIDMAGGLAGALIYWAWRRRRNTGRQYRRF